MNLARPLAVLDLEATGLEISTDRIVSLAITKILHPRPLDKPDHCLTREGRAFLFNPGIPIPAEVTEIHGIDDAMVKGAPLFKSKAGEVLKFIQGADLGGFNLKNFDVPMLWEEFYRAGVQWDLAGISIVDAGSIFKKHEERTLEAAVKFYCGREHKNAHDAGADVTATIDVLEAQITRYGLPQTVQELAKAGLEDNRMDLAGKVMVDKDGDPCYGFGKYRFNHKSRTGMKIKDDPGLAEWALSKDFSAQTKLVLRKVLEDIRIAEQAQCDIERLQAEANGTKPLF